MSSPSPRRSRRLEAVARTDRYAQSLFHIQSRNPWYKDFLLNHRFQTGFTHSIQVSRCIFISKRKSVLIMSIRTPDWKATTRSYPRLAKGTTWPGNHLGSWQATPKPPQTNLPPFGCQSQPQAPKVNRVGKAPRLFSGNRAEIKLLVRSLHTSTGAYACHFFTWFIYYSLKSFVATNGHLNGGSSSDELSEDEEDNVLEDISRVPHPPQRLSSMA